MKSILSSIALSCLCAGALAEDQVGQMTNDDPTWNRLSDTGATATGFCDGVVAPDSVNDGVPFQLFYFTATVAGTPLDVLVDSLEATPLGFDPFVAIYCDTFDHSAPMTNLLHVDDDGAGYPNAHALNTQSLIVDARYIAVVSSYSNWAPSRLGEFQVTLGAGLSFIAAPCTIDYTGDGTLNFFDVGDFLSLYAAQDPLADLDGNGSFNFFDVAEFLDLFAVGCP